MSETALRKQRTEGAHLALPQVSLFNGAQLNGMIIKTPLVLYFNNCYRNALGALLLSINVSAIWRERVCLRAREYMRRVTNFNG